MFFIETIKTSKFKDALFTDPSLVGEESNLNRTVYTDGTSRLEANQKTTASNISIVISILVPYSKRGFDQAKREVFQ